MIDMLLKYENGMDPKLKKKKKRKVFKRAVSSRLFVTTSTGDGEMGVTACFNRYMSNLIYGGV